MNAVASQTPARISPQIYTANQQRDPTAFLMWHLTPRIAENRDPGRISLLHFVSHYASRMGRLPCKWDGAFATHGDESYGTMPLAVWDPTYLHLTPAVHVPSAAAIDMTLSGDANLTLLGPYGAGDSGVEIIRCRKTVYVPALYVGLMLGGYLTPVEAWNRLWVAIFDAVAEDACRPLIDWLHAAIVRSVPNTYSMLVFPKPSAPLPNALLLQHRHRLLLSHLPGLDPSINRASGTRIVETVGEVAVELRETRLENKRVREQKDNKGVTE